MDGGCWDGFLGSRWCQGHGGAGECLGGASWVVVQGSGWLLGVTRASGMCGEQACYCVPQPLPLPRLDLSNCSLHSVPPGLAEATAAIVL